MLHLVHPDVAVEILDGDRRSAVQRLVAAQHEFMLKLNEHTSSPK